MSSKTIGVSMYVIVATAILAVSAALGFSGTPWLLAWTGYNLVARTYAQDGE